MAKSFYSNLKKVRAIAILQIALMASLLACSNNSNETPIGDAGVTENNSNNTKDIKFQWCVGAKFAPEAKTSWNHTDNTIITALSEPVHAVQDSIALPGSPISVSGKMAYGLLSADLGDESVKAFYYDCTKWRAIGEKTTNDDGQITFDIKESLPVGVYEVKFEVMGDASVATGKVWVLPKGARLAISDIDGTLTTSDIEIVKETAVGFFGKMLGKDYSPEAYPAASELSKALNKRGLLVVYLTGRPQWLGASTRDWLESGSFASGPLHLTESAGQVLPTTEGVGDFKLGFLKKLNDAGFIIEEAYGNADTDIYAYLGANISAANIYIIGDKGGEQGTSSVQNSWSGRVKEIAALPEVEQPFAW